MDAVAETRHATFRADRDAEQRKNRPVQCADGQPAEGRQLSRRHGRAQKWRLAHAVRRARSAWSTCPAPIRCARARPTRKSPRDVRARPLESETPPDLLRLRRGRHQSAAGAAAGARAQARGPPAPARAQHDRHRQAARHGDRPARMSAESGRAGRHRGRGAPRRHRRSAGAARRTAARTDLPAGRRRGLGGAEHRANCAPPSAKPTASSRSRSSMPRKAGYADHAARRRAAASGVRPRHPARLLFVMFQAVFSSGRSR